MHYAQLQLQNLLERCETVITSSYNCCCFFARSIRLRSVVEEKEKEKEKEKKNKKEKEKGLPCAAARVAGGSAGLKSTTMASSASRTPAMLSQSPSRSVQLLPATLPLCGRS